VAIGFDLAAQWTDFGRRQFSELSVLADSRSNPGQSGIRGRAQVSRALCSAPGADSPPIIRGQTAVHFLAAYRISSEHYVSFSVAGGQSGYCSRLSATPCGVLFCLFLARSVSNLSSVFCIGFIVI
jgi:hypothetical protein